MPLPAAATEALVPPRHVAIIMDGNGRWAAARHLPRLMGHRAGVAAVRATVRAAIELGIPFLTLYGFSSENWKRPRTEIADLMGLLRNYIREDLDQLHRNNVEVRIIGTRTHLEPDIIELIELAQSRTKGNRGLKLTIAFNYGGQDEIVDAVRRIAADAAAGKIKPDSIDKEMFAKYLATSGLPDPDLLIRTSGEQRLSNFLTWQSAYTEFVFIDAFWPDFNKSHLIAAITEFNRRERRFGGRNVADGRS
ncbi:MAG: isoprenyl transferase [Alphaproteobacteria bacterium]|nr:isoprenyl transferase [Alphaproteobacteria bacterium]